MAKKNKTAAESAAKAAAEQQVPETKTVEEPSFAKVVTLSKDKSLSSGEKVILANLVQEAWVKDPKYASIVDGAVILRDALMGDVIVTQIVNGVDTFAMIVRKDEQRYLAIKSMLASQGINLPDFKALPAPTEEQLKTAGVKLLPAESVVVPVTADNVSKEAIDQKKAEKKIEDSHPTTNPAEIQNEKQLAASLSNLLTSGNDGLNIRVQRVINFYRGYLTIQANNAENKEEALAAMKAKSRSDMLQEIADIVGQCPFAFTGAAHMLLTRLQSTKTILTPFCLYRRTANTSADKNPIEDTFVADIVRILITWSCKSFIARKEKTIADWNRQIHKKEDEINKISDKGEIKIAKAAISAFNGQIEKTKQNAKVYEDLLEMMNNIDFTGIDTLIADYDADVNTPEYKMSHTIVDTIMKTYYKDLDVTKLDKSVMLSNVQQRAGIIVNMFRDPLSQSISYTESNIVEMKEAETSEEKAEEKPAEEEPKN